MGISAKDRRQAAANNNAVPRSSSGKTTDISITDVISEGPIFGLVEGPASVFLDQRGIMDAGKGLHYSSKGSTRIQLTNGDSVATLLNASPETLRRLRDTQDKIEYLIVRGGQGKINVNLSELGEDFPGIMKATKSGGKDFVASMVDDWKGYTGTEVVVPARLEGTSYTNNRSIEITIVKRVSSTEAHIKIGDRDSSRMLSMPAGAYTIEVDALVDISEVTSVTGNQISQGKLTQAFFRQERLKKSVSRITKTTSYNHKDWQTNSDSGKTGYDFFGPPFEDQTSTSGRGRTKWRRKFTVQDVSSIVKGYERDHSHYIWFGYFRPPETGTYEFLITSDDGAAMWLGHSASVDRDTNEKSNKSLRNLKNALINVWGRHSPKTVTATKKLTAGEYYPIRIVHYNHEGPATIEFRHRKVGEDFTSSLSNFYYPNNNSADQKTFVDMENLKLSANWTGDTGTYEIDLGQGDPEEDFLVDYSKSDIKGGSVGFRVGDLFQSRIPSIVGYGGQNITVSPKMPVPLDIHSDFVTGDNIPDGVTGVQTTTITGSADQGGLGLSPEQIRNIDTLRIAIQYPNGFYQTNDDGKVKGGVNVYAVSAQFKNPGETQFETEEYLLVEDLIHKVSFPGNKGTKDSITFTFDIALERFAPFIDFKIHIKRKTASDGKKGYHVEGSKWKQGLKGGLRPTSPANIGPCTAIISDVLTYPYTAYAKVTYNTASFREMPKRLYHCKGLLVKVPSNYVTRDEAYDGVASYTRDSSGNITASYQDWDGSLRAEPVYTNNPAWIFYDIVTNNRYGLGDYMSATDIDIYSLYRISRYCDEMVETGKDEPAFEPRFTCNVYFTKQADAYKVLKDLCTSFRSMLYWFDSQIVPVLDHPKDPVYNFSKANVVEGNFSYESTGSKTRANQVLVSWNNPLNDYKLEGLLCEDKLNIIDTGKVILEKAHAVGCTSESQAKRYGKWKLWTALNQTEVVTFETAMAARFLVPGDVISIQDSDRARVRYSGRVSNTGVTNSNTVSLDSPVTLKSGHTYRLSVLLVTPGAFLVEKTASINTTTNGNPITYNAGDLVTHAWFYDESAQEWNREAIDTEAKATNARANTTTLNALHLSWAPHTRVETKDVSSSQIGTTVSSISIDGAFSGTPDSETIWVLEEFDEDSLATQESAVHYKILTIEEKENSIFNISAAKHFNEKFEAVDSLDYTLQVEAYPMDELPKEPKIPQIQALSLSITE